MKRFLSLLLLSVFVVLWAGCQKEPSNPTGSEYTEEDGGGGSQTEMIYYEFPNNIQLEDCKEYVTDLVINDDLSDWDGSGSEIVGTLTVKQVDTDPLFLYFIFKLNDDYDNGNYYIKTATGDGWVVTPGNGRYVPPGIRSVTQSYSYPNTLCTLKLAKNEVKTIGPKTKDYSFDCNDYLGLAGWIELCPKGLFQLPLLPGDGQLVTMNIYYPNPNISYFKTKVSVWGTTEYEGWCVDIGNSITNGTHTGVQLWSSLSPSLPQAVKDQINKDQYLPNVNWIINTITPGYVTPHGAATWEDIQEAIWRLLDEGTHGSANGNDNRAIWIKNQAIEFGNDYHPDCNGKIAMILFKAGIQVTIVVREFLELYPQFCGFQYPECQNAWAFGNKRYCLQIPGFPGRYWYWVTTGYKWCCEIP